MADLGALLSLAYAYELLLNIGMHSLLQYFAAIETGKEDPTAEEPVEGKKPKKKPPEQGSQGLGLVTFVSLKVMHSSLIIPYSFLRRQGLAYLH